MDVFKCLCSVIEIFVFQVIGFAVIFGIAYVSAQYDHFDFGNDHQGIDGGSSYTSFSLGKSVKHYSGLPSYKGVHSGLSHSHGHHYHEEPHVS